MRKTGTQIQGDIMLLLRKSPLAGIVSGDIYRNGLRPRDSRQEDIIVTYTAGIPGQIQTGVVTVNIYVPDIDPYDNGVLVCNGARCAEIEVAAQEWVESLTAKGSNYRFELQQTIMTCEDWEVNQHFVCVKLKYKLFE
ncbi:MAG: hypothetical protein NC324_03075 [Bacteroides sp.]|nr:hypothetical protein [Bacteroides sp.]